MKQFCCVALALVLALCGAACGAPADSGGSGPVEKAGSSEPFSHAAQAEAPPQLPPEVDGPQWLRIPAPSLAGNLIGEPLEQDIGLCLPPGYYRGGTYPVVYYLTGYTEDYRTRTETFFATMQRLYQQQAAQQMIVVVINGGNRFGGSWYANSSVTGNWEDYVVDDVVPYIDTHYTTRPNKESRCLMGHSMGGAGVLSIAMHRPGYFSCAWAMSPAVLAPGGFNEFGVDFSIIDLVAADYAALDASQAADAYREHLSQIPSPFYWTLGYASAFAPQPQGPPPYAALPRNRQQPEAGDAAWDAYLNGAGGWAHKAEQYAGALRQLHCLTIDYGTQDENSWLPPGCRYLEEQLTARQIPHQCIAYEGNHTSEVNARIERDVMPLFASHLAAGSA